MRLYRRQNAVDAGSFASGDIGCRIEQRYQAAFPIEPFNEGDVLSIAVAE